MSEDVPPYAVNKPGDVTLIYTPVRSQCTIGGPNGIVIRSATPAPNRFWRIMQRWCLGIVWEVIDQD